MAMIDPATALERLRRIVGPAGVVEPAQAKRHLLDGRGLHHGAAALVVQPATVGECSEVLAVCHDAGLGVVPQGGHTGYCGGATPFDAQRQVVVSMARLNRVHAVDPIGFTMTVEAGVTLAQARAAAAGEGLLFPLSMASEQTCQIGGNVSTNAGGLAVLRYGTMRDLVLGLEVVLPSGRVLSQLNALRKDNTGYDLKALFVGAEGTLGLVTAAVLRLFPLPRARATAWLALSHAEAAPALLARARQDSGDQVVSAEYVSRLSLDLVLRHTPHTRDPLPHASRAYGAAPHRPNGAAPHRPNGAAPRPRGSDGHYLLLELASADEHAVLRRRLGHLIAGARDAGEVLDAWVARTDDERRALWRLRENVPPSERLAGGALKHDVSVPIASMPAFLDTAATELPPLADHRLSVYGHIGDGNLHYNLLPPAGGSLDAFVAQHGAALTRRVHDIAMRLRGSFSAEHGIGVLKRNELARYHSRDALDAMRAIKGAFDPRGIMNPGKVLDEGLER